MQIKRNQLHGKIKEIKANRLRCGGEEKLKEASTPAAAPSLPRAHQQPP
jgi:hypothetical protein